MLLASTLISSSIAGYTLSQDYTSSNFFDGFDFFTAADPTNGHVQFLGMDAANKSGIAGRIQGPNMTDAIYLSVDSNSVAPQGRGALRLSSNRTFHQGLFVADIAHMPGGICGVWNAFWTFPNSPEFIWPAGGEIDILEGVNDQAANKMTLHTTAGATISSSEHFSGSLVTSNCDINAPNQDRNAGCQISDTDELTFGLGFNNATGGTYATEWTSEAIKIWFWPRGSVPSDIKSGKPNPSAAWGVPKSQFSGFNVDKFFNTPHSLIFDTTFCGDWAGETWSNSTCTALAPTCEAYVTNNPAAFKDAYWAINSVKVFQADRSTSNSTVTRRWRSGGAVLPPRPGA